MPKAYLLIVACICLSAAPIHALELKSPGGRLVLTCGVSGGCPVYSVAANGAPVIAESRLALELAGVPLTNGLTLVNSTTGSHDETWRPVYGERSAVRDHYHQLVVDLEEAASPHRHLRLTFRAFDAGVAFCYTLPAQAAMTRAVITRERTEFRFCADHTAWAVYAAQGRYDQTRLSKLRPGCERPLVLQISENAFVALAEAGLVDYARMKFAPLAGHPHAVVSELSGPVDAALPLNTPWRVIMAAENPGELLENNDIILNLNAPCALADTAWIKPGKVLREMTLTTAGSKAGLDFAAQHHLQYLLFDAGWYGPESSPASDATGVHLDPARSQGPLDLPEVIRCARTRDIGVLLYVNHLAAERQLDAILPLYRQWGIRGVKFGYVNVGPQRWTSWLHHAIRQAATNQLMVDVHDEYRPTGYARTYPNLMTVEGISGDETCPDNRQTLTLLFTRMLAGPADNTICYYNARVDRNASHAYQLAKAVCLYSPLQHLYWYDRPPGSPRPAGADSARVPVIGEEPELEFFDAVPTVWDDTKVIHGRIGEYAVIARRHGADWYLGCMNAGTARTLDVPLTFLGHDHAFVAHIYADDPTMPTRTHVRISRWRVTPATILKIAMAAKGGQAIRLVPASGQEPFSAYPAIGQN